MEINYSKRRRNACFAAAAWFVMGVYSRVHLLEKAADKIPLRESMLAGSTHGPDMAAPPLEIIELEKGQEALDGQANDSASANEDQDNILLLGFDADNNLPGRTDSMVAESMCTWSAR
jgi:hypothetical protein